jgi:alanyl-tRNA synthetase
VLTQVGAAEQLDEGLTLVKLRESPFYPAGGGQVTDAGHIEADDGRRAELREAYRFDGDQALLVEGDAFAAGDRVRAVVPWAVRYPTMANHTATHVLHEVLRRVLGTHVKQAGSAVRPDKLRFDFTHPQALTREERAEVERGVNETVFENLPVTIYETPIHEARKLGAQMLFGEKYGDIVRVVEIGGEWSRELCGGTHVRSTAEIGPFAIVTEGSVGSGARRIEAVTAGEAYAWLRELAHEADELRTELERTRKEAKKAPAKQEVSYDLRYDEALDGVNVAIGRVATDDPNVLLDAADKLKQQKQPAAVLLAAANGKVSLVAMIDASLEKRLSAVDWVKAAAAPVGGGGGGRPTMARAGGKDPEKLPEALESAWEWIKASLS